MYDTLAVGEQDTLIHITVYTSTTHGEEILNLHVRSIGNPSLADSITTYTLAGVGIGEDEPVWKSRRIGLRVVPNPVRSGATVNYEVPELPNSRQTRCNMALYDINGRPVRTLLDSRCDAGQHRLQWSQDEKLPGGVYLLRLTAGSESTVCKVMLRP